MNDITLHRHKDGKLAIATAPEIFICTRACIQDLVDRHNQRIDEITRLEAELAKASRLQQTVTIAGQTIQDLTKENDLLRRLNIDATRLASRYATALHEIANTDYRGNRSAEQTIAYAALTTTEP